MAHLRVGARTGYGKVPRQTVFYVIYHDLGNILKPDVKQVLDSEIYIEWPEGVRSQKWVDQFFERLVGTIRGEQIFGGCHCFTARSQHGMVAFDQQ